MKLFLKYQLLFMLLVAGLSGYSQDIHFSQFYQSPFSLNPALVGDFDGAYRLIGNQRSQWRSVTVPYTTWGFSGDANKILNSNYSAGVSLFTDKAGDSQLKTTMLNLVFGRSFTPTNKEKDQLNVGAMFGLTFMSIDYSALRYDNQWNGFSYDPSINAGEQYTRDSRSYLNLNIGASYSYFIDDTRSLKGGVALFNLSNPKQSFFDQAFVRLDPRVVVHGNYLQKLNDQWQIEPMLLFMSQAKFIEFNIGGRGYYVLDNRSWNYEALYFGFLGRTRDAGNIIAGMKYHQWDVGLSYDVNLSSLKPASSGRGGFEIGVIYIIPHSPTIGDVKKICPDYI
ncbi:MAG: PorP/SprF family type IX secretion system membrane protein [Flavobacteriales bacterium]